ncbi:MAG TPA: (4Fe-4S)-binding protein [Candidatus Altiarchaeales archaeon]|nr:(4Fe-4S)-binding protein [Candidatus Altiarchaeales archaeon]
MIVSIASGKGGTGKTTVAVNLARTLQNIVLLDCDVEEPNCHVFLNPEKVAQERVSVSVPNVDLDKCVYCGKCASFCRYNALAVSKDVLMFFPELCHGCGGCGIVCPVEAISEAGREIGVIKKSLVDGIDFRWGVLDIGQAQASPLIKKVRDVESAGKDVLVDAPPGTSCATISAVEGSDYCILVTEPTPFGLNDLKLAVEMLKTMGIPHGVVMNKDGVGNSGVDDYCSEEGIPIILRIPHSRKIARLYSDGKSFTDDSPAFREKFRIMFEDVRRQVE